MAPYMMWAMACLVTGASLFFAFKTISAVKDGLKKQKQYQRELPDLRQENTGLGTMLMYILLGFLFFSFATTASMSGSSSFSMADQVFFFGVGLFCVVKSIDAWFSGRVYFYKTGFIYRGQNIPFSAVKELNKGGGHYYVALKKESIPVNAKTWQLLGAIPSLTRRVKAN